MKKIEKVGLLVLIVIAAWVLAGCSQEENTLHLATKWKGNDTMPMGSGDYASYGYWYIRSTVLATLGGFFWSALLVSNPLAIIMGVTGWQFGRKEMILEGLLIVGLGALLLAIGPYSQLGLTGWVFALTIVPGLLITFWRTEGGKLWMFIGLDILFVIYMAVRCFDQNAWRVLIIAAVLVLKVIVISALFSGSEKQSAVAASH
jgi:hypothetical protein